MKCHRNVTGLLISAFQFFPLKKKKKKNKQKANSETKLEWIWGLSWTRLLGNLQQTLYLPTSQPHVQEIGFAAHLASVPS